jgi:serine/threonine protein kinase
MSTGDETSRHTGDETRSHTSDLDRTSRIDELCERFESQWSRGLRPDVDSYLTEVDAELQPLLRRELETLRLELARRGDPGSGSATWPALGGVVGEYELLEEIGQGGMGHVYKARHVHMGRVVALKRLSPSLVSGDPLRASRRFRREVRATARLRHPNVVTAFDAGEHQGVPYLVMEYIEGIDLARLVRQRGPLAISDALSLLIQVARGLDYAHREGVIHRDVKPSNLHLGSQGDVKVLDLGLARIQAPEEVSTASGEASADLTSSGTFLGSVDYMAPEQALDTRSADARSDIYSLGCTLHYLLTGRSVFAGNSTLERLIAHRELPPPSLKAQRPDCPDPLDALFQRMVAKRPEDRPQSVSDLAAELEDCRRMLGPEHARPAPVQPAPFLPPRAISANFDSEPAFDSAQTVPDPALRGTRGRIDHRRLIPYVALLVFAGFAFLALRPRAPGRGGVLLMTDQLHVNGAQVKIDGVRVAQMGAVGDALPYAAFDVTAGFHEIEISKPGYKPLKTSFTVAPGGRWEISIRLFPEDAPSTPSAHEQTHPPSPEATIRTARARAAIGCDTAQASPRNSPRSPPRPPPCTLPAPPRPSRARRSRASARR